MPRARRDESKILQVLTAEYLREKGAPKVSVMYAYLTCYSGKLMTDLGMYEWCSCGYYPQRKER